MKRLIFTLAGCAILLLIPYISISLQHTPESWLDYNQVRGMATKHKGQLYTLNFEQQNKVIAILNHAKPTQTASESEPSLFDFESLIIYRFHQPNLELYPIKHDGANLIFEISGTGTMVESGQGTIHKLLLQTIEP